MPADSWLYLQKQLFFSGKGFSVSVHWFTFAIRFPFLLATVKLSLTRDAAGPSLAWFWTFFLPCLTRAGVLFWPLLCLIVYRCRFEPAGY